MKQTSVPMGQENSSIFSRIYRFFWNQYQKIYSLVYPDDALIMAADRGQTDAVLTLIFRGADVNACNGEQDTPLGNAAYGNHIETALTLIQYGAHPYVSTDRAGHTLFHMLVGSCNTEILLALIEKGFAKKWRDVWENTLLHLAADAGLTQVVTVLLKKGANADAVNSQKQTPRQLAENKGHTDVVSLFDACKIATQLPSEPKCTAIVVKHDMLRAKKGPAVSEKPSELTEQQQSANDFSCLRK